jgi:dTDP-glucose 4,6-dehydratase
MRNQTLLKHDNIDFQQMTIVITGGCGFIGSFLVKSLMDKHPSARIIIIDRLTYASRGLQRVRQHLLKDNVELWTWDLGVEISDGMLAEMGDIQIIYHLAAHTHVDTSIQKPNEVVQNNIMCTLGTLDLARRCSKLQCFLLFSTDEVFGTCLRNQMPYTEKDLLNPSNPYSASKAASELIAKAFHNTYGVPLKIVRCMNVLGFSQDAEKFVPKIIQCALKGETLKLHCDSHGVWGSRGYLGANDASRAAMFVAEKGVVGEVYNIPCAQEIDNLEVVEIIEETLGCKIKRSGIVFDETRPGHDMRYAIDGDKIFALGWRHEDRDMQAYIRHCSKDILAMMLVTSGEKLEVVSERADDFEKEAAACFF